jgi:hypothetical protein
VREALEANWRRQATITTADRLLRPWAVCSSATAYADHFEREEADRWNFDPMCSHAASPGACEMQPFVTDRSNRLRYRRVERP